MKKPNIPHIIKSLDGKTTYKVMAYRNLIREEVVAAVQQFNSSIKNTPITGEIEILTSLR